MIFIGLAIAVLNLIDLHNERKYLKYPKVLEEFPIKFQGIGIYFYEFPNGNPITYNVYSKLFQLGRDKITKEHALTLIKKDIKLRNFV